MGGSIETIASIAEQRVLNLNLTDGSKNEVLQKYCTAWSIYCTRYPAVCWIGGRDGGADGAVQ